MPVVELNYQRDPASGAVQFGASGYPLVVANPSAATYGEMQARIQHEVLGDITIDDIKNAIQDAIAEYEAQSFWFNQIRLYGSPGSGSNLQTVNGQEFYSAQDLPVLTVIPHISKVMVLAFANRYSLVERTYQWIDDVSLSTTWQGLPTDWAYQSQSLRLYPVPNGNYPLIIDVTTRFQPLVNDSDYNVWTNRGALLIRTEAKRLLFRNLTRDEDQAQYMEQELQGDPQSGRQGVLAMLRRETMRRAGGTGRIRGSRGYM